MQLGRGGAGRGGRRGTFKSLIREKRRAWGEKGGLREVEQERGRGGAVRGCIGGGGSSKVAEKKVKKI